MEFTQGHLSAEASNDAGHALRAQVGTYSPLLSMVWLLKFEIPLERSLAKCCGGFDVLENFGLFAVQYVV